MRPLEDLLDDAPAWPLLQSWIAEATNHVVVLPAIREDGEAVLQRLQITTRSPLGAVALETGGILIDHAWVRLLGCGSPRLRSTLASWNTISDEPEIEPLQHALIVGFDAVGGFFAINGGEFDGERGHVFFFTPDTLEWESLERGYFDFLHWTLTADLGSFYNELRWPGWEDELVDATGDLGFALYPPPFTKQGRPTSGVSRRLIPIRELWLVQQEYRRQLADVPSGAEISFKIRDRRGRPASGLARSSGPAFRNVTRAAPGRSAAAKGLPNTAYYPFSGWISAEWISADSRS